MNPIMQQLQAEAQRKFGGQPSSNVGMRPNPSASQPVNPSSPASPVMPSQSDPFGGGAAAMNGSMPMKGGTALEKALIKRMNMYPPQ